MNIKITKKKNIISFIIGFFSVFIVYKMRVSQSNWWPESPYSFKEKVYILTITFLIFFAIAYLSISLFQKKKP